MSDISSNQITLPLARFAEASGKSERQVRKDIAEGKYKSVIDGGRNLILIDTYRAYLGRLRQEQQKPQPHSPHPATKMGRRRGRYAGGPPVYPDAA
jgi:hypothetical protein